MKPYIGAVLCYTLTGRDALQINRRRTSSDVIQFLVKYRVWPTGAQAHIGSPVTTGQVLPLIVTAVWPHEFGDEPGVNGQVLLDGCDTLWVTSVGEDLEPLAEDQPHREGKWFWMPPRDLMMEKSTKNGGTTDGQSMLVKMKSTNQIMYVNCPKHGAHKHAITGTIKDHEGTWCQICWVESLGPMIASETKKG